MEQIILQGITADELLARFRGIIKEENKQSEPLLNKAQSLKLSGVSWPTFRKAINSEVIIPQYCEDLKRPMYLKSQVLNIEKYKKYPKKQTL